MDIQMSSNMAVVKLAVITNDPKQQDWYCIDLYRPV
jgi:hypothetical protein